MSLAADIVEWSLSRPWWQQQVMTRSAAGEILTADEYDHLLEEILSGSSSKHDTLSVDDLSWSDTKTESVRLLSVTNPEHVNALASAEPLTCAPEGITIVYGDNGCGKSGYARILKRIARARHQEEILSDVFRDTTAAKPKAFVKVLISDQELELEWPEHHSSEVQRMRFFDAHCGVAYISSESDFPYRPSELFVVDGLIEACVAVRERIDARLQQNSVARETLPAPSDEAAGSPPDTFLRGVSADTPIADLDSIIQRLDHAEATPESLLAEENRLRAGDTTSQRQTMRHADKLSKLGEHLARISAALGTEQMAALATERREVESLEESSRLAAQSFANEPIQGVGNSAWRELWDSARRFSESTAYRELAFPHIDSGARCVFCQQNLHEDARDRLARFESFVQADVQVRLDERRRSLGEKESTIARLVVLPENIIEILRDLATIYPRIASDAKDVLEQYQSVQKEVQGSLEGEQGRKQPDVAAITSRITEAASAARESAERLADPALLKEEIAKKARLRAELELIQSIKDSRDTITREIARLKEKRSLEEVKTSAATGPITRKIAEWSENSITEVVRDSFTRETERLRLERVTISKTRAEHARLLHQPKLVGTRQDVTVPKILSEGEKTALGLAAFFTEVQLDGSQSALIIDDPVSSLDHIRRELVAARIADLAENRQVIIFTHDVSFVADLKREAGGRGISIAERSVVRSRAGEKKPGSCTNEHPWKAKDVPQRFDELGRMLARIKREQESWTESEYESEVAIWAGHLSETWERIFSQEIAGALVTEGGLEVRPNMVKVLARFTEDDDREFQASYKRVSQWAKRHDKSAKVNYVAPDVAPLESELESVKAWFARIRKYRN
ncbi:MAG: AAA family ATPase [Leptospirales bacterium]|nr:AAA family ATPase [Leptospirales bacterium]